MNIGQDSKKKELNGSNYNITNQNKLNGSELGKKGNLKERK